MSLSNPLTRLPLLSLVGLVGLAGMIYGSLTPSAWSAPCCARNGATPALILGDDEAQINLGASFANAVAEANEDGSLTFGNKNISDQSLVYRLDSALLITDRFQIGAGISLIQHSVSRFDQSSSVTGLGDSRLSAGYELLPLWTYSNWKPQIFLFSTFLIPTGRSKYEFQNDLLADVRGVGFYTASIGGLILKRWNAWDAFLLPEVHYFFPRTFDQSSGTLIAYPGLGGSLGIGGGWSPDKTNFRVGLRIQPRLDQSVTTITATQTSRGQGLLSVCDTGFDVAYLLGATDSLMFSYTDQTVLGVAMNQNVNRTAALTLQHRWER